MSVCVKAFRLSKLYMFLLPVEHFDQTSWVERKGFPPFRLVKYPTCLSGRLPLQKAKKLLAEVQGRLPRPGVHEEGTLFRGY